MERELYCTLEELYNGASKKLKITKRVMGLDKRATETVEKVLTVDVKPGWKVGTKVTFAKEGDEGPDVIPADVVLVVHEKPHSRFKRDGADLIYEAEISLTRALTGCTIDVATLDNRLLTIPIAEVVAPGYEKVIKGEGMPLSKKPGEKGDLKIRFNIVFPHYLTDKQRDGIKKLLPEA